MSGVAEESETRKKKMVFVTADIDCGRFFCFIPMSAPTQHTGIGDLCVCNREREWGGWSIKTFGFSFRDQACTWVNGNWDDFVFVYAPADTFGLFRMCFWCSSLKSVPSLYVFFFFCFVCHSPLFPLACGSVCTIYVHLYARMYLNIASYRYDLLFHGTIPYHFISTRSFAA